MTNKQTVLITGAAGFIGFHLAKKLLAEGFEVVGLDNLNDYYDVNLKYDRLRELGLTFDEINDRQVLRSDQGFTFYKVDLIDQAALEKIFTENKLDYVVNLAAQAGVRYSLQNPRAYINSNIIGFFNVLELCQKFKIKHLVYASSSSVYGSNTKLPFSTSDSVDHPVSLYAATKKSDELMAHTYSHLHQLPTTGLRFFTVYGPWGRPDMAAFTFTKKILAGEPIEVYNFGNMKRDFTYVDDIVEGVYRAMLKTPEGESGAPYKVYNIGNNKPVELLKFIEILENNLGKKADKKLLPLQPGDVLATFADIDDLTRDIGFKPSTSIEEGLKEFVAWYLNYYR